MPWLVMHLVFLSLLPFDVILHDAVKFTVHNAHSFLYFMEAGKIKGAVELEFKMCLAVFSK